MNQTLWRGDRPPWPQQREAFVRCADLLAQHRRCRGLVVKPTGCGKSRVMRALCYWLVCEQRRRAVVALPTEEILDQFANDLRRECRIPFYIEKAEKTAPPYSQITLASQQSLWRRLRLQRYRPDTVLLFDEGHHGNPQALRNLDTLQHFDQVLGFSASPWSEECKAVYSGQVLFEYPLSRAIADGYLCRYALWPFPPIVPRPEAFELYYCATNEEARALARNCPGAAYLGHDSLDRSAVVQGFRSGRVKRIYCNRMLTEGFDEPRVATIYVDKAPESELLIYQMIGRGLRKKPGGGVLTVYAQDLVGVRAALARAG